MGTGQSKAERERIGEGRLYLNYILKLYEQVSLRGKQMMMWDDIIVKYPDLVPQLPYDLIAMVWGYEADHPFDERCGLFLNANIPFYVCPGSSSWNTFAGRTDNATGNLRSAAENGLKHGAIGFLITDWGDYGHWQPNSASYLGFAYGAAVSWSLETNGDLDLPAVLDAFVFEDQAGIMGKLVYDLGNVYLIPGHSRGNGHKLVDVMRMDATDSLPDVDSLRQAITRVQEIIAPLEDTNIQRPDADLIQYEYILAADLIKHAARLGLFLQGEGNAAELRGELEMLIARHRETWLARNRPGGLEDSVARFTPALKTYQ